MGSSFSTTIKVPPNKAVAYIAMYIAQGYIIYYNPNTELLRLTKKEKNNFFGLE